MVRFNAHYQVEELEPGVTRIVGGVGECAYLVEGRDRAALIDTTTGYTGLSQLVKLLTPLPVIVLLTHGHRDHTGGAGEFEEVYLHPADKALTVRGMTLSARRAFVAGREPEYYKTIGPMDFLPEKRPGLRPLAAGMTFDLGGAVLETIPAPGHTAGSVCFLDQGRRLLFSGDVCTCKTYLMLPESASVPAYLRSLVGLQRRAEQWDRIFTGHTPGEAPGEVFLNQLECGLDVLLGRDDRVAYTSVSGDGWLARRTTDPACNCRADGVYGNIVYTDEKKRG